MTEAICLRCGSRKRRPWHQCSQCGFDPRDDNDALVKSVYLSTGRFENPEQHDKYRHELEAIGEQLCAGQSIEFDREELARLAAQHELVQSVPFVALLGAVTRLFLPAIAFIGVLFAIGWMIRHLARG
ncbi:MAG: hypothetical protein ACM3U2_17255 [Deltaproteobacteria bacterium]